MRGFRIRTFQAIVRRKQRYREKNFSPVGLARGRIGPTSARGATPHVTGRIGSFEQPPHRQKRKTSNSNRGRGRRIQGRGRRHPPPNADPGLTGAPSMKPQIEWGRRHTHPPRKRSRDNGRQLPKSPGSNPTLCRTSKDTPWIVTLFTDTEQRRENHGSATSTAAVSDAA